MTVVRILVLFILTIIFGIYVFDKNNEDKEAIPVMHQLANRVGLTGYLEEEKEDEEPILDQELLRVDEKIKVNQKQIFEIKSQIESIVEIRAIEDQDERINQYETVKIQVLVFLAQLIDGSKEFPEIEQIFNQLDILMEGKVEDLTSVCANPQSCLNEKIEEQLKQLMLQIEKEIDN